ncbi:glycosyltransferase family 4 protein [Aliirhizobium smilacinae]|uniref:Glycosyltransferase family 4 protein n=1 Tax=Aliirhizobium smilacinae TaxID=1395944 RepID=A0A5C4XPY7_9HYPH|nr:glycosyltransferase family 4 protein [Rhizobium smilacinae]TNM65319.1 glycosyltransferase family 4 protein [Rhizobium smilacinae]
MHHPVTTIAKPKVGFLALDTWSRVGGLQRFNQRVISNLASAAEEGRLSRPVMHVMRDVSSDLPSLTAADLKGYGPNRLAFIRAALVSASKLDIMFLGQVNLLPVGWMAKQLNRKLKLAMFVHGVEVWNDPIYRKKRFYEPTMLRAVDRIASVSDYTANVMAKEFGVNRAKFSILPNAVDGPIEITPRSSTEPMLLCVTRMAPHDHGKRVDSVLRAFSKLTSGFPDSRLEIIGDGPLRPELEKLAHDLGVAERVLFRGRVSDEELDRAYRRARAFVLPSVKEGFGIVYLEAWKYGLPVICSNAGASHEIISHGGDGFVVDPSDIDRLADHMGVLLSDLDRGATMGQAGAEKLREKYLNDSFRLNLLTLLDEIK